METERTLYEQIPAIDLLLDIAPSIVIKNDREKYKKYMIIAENFFIANGLIIADSTVFDEINLTNYSYSVYCDDAVVRSKQLARLIYESDKTGLARYTTVVPKIPDYLYIVSVDMRSMFIFMNTKFGRHERFDEIIQTIPKKALFTGKEIRCLEPIAQLTEIYSQLSDPAEAETWPELLKKEAQLRAFIHNEKYISKSTGVNLSSTKAAIIANRGASDNFIKDFLTTLNTKIVVGEGALCLYNIIPTLNTLQVVSTTFDDDKKFLHSNQTKYDISIAYEYPKILCDSRHIKLIVGKKVNGEFINILEIFNAGDFSLIPYNIVNNYEYFSDAKNAQSDNESDVWMRDLIKIKNIKVGTAFSLMRFLTFDLWQYKCSRYFKNADEEYIQTVIDSIMAMYFEIEVIVINIMQEIDTSSDKKNAIDKLLPHRRYLGKYTRFALEMRRNITKKDIYKLNKYVPFVVDH